ncbi:MAG: hypothetical protein CVV41_02410 [Candidatus Riflebacteria bacterium HGW-Riflebacteria-1]|jgi:hypothetical protein|nr:MAG: hypothetical protein CVV41_02410 [Candidatus Riflebacteria bacterium HGW-Riflebacteria-1]
MKKRRWHGRGSLTLRRGGTEKAGRVNRSRPQDVGDTRAHQDGSARVMPQIGADFLRELRRQSYDLFEVMKRVGAGMSWHEEVA